MFDVVIGNPPYQQEVGGGKSTAIFDKFIDLGYQIGNYSTLITPARWLTDQKYTKLREQILKSIEKIAIYKDCHEVFKTISCGSLSIYLINKHCKNNEIEVSTIGSNSKYFVPFQLGYIPLDKHAIDIINKCKCSGNAFKFKSRRIFGTQPRWVDGTKLLNVSNRGRNYNYLVYMDKQFITYRCDKEDLINTEYSDKYRVVIASNINLNDSVIGATTITEPGTASDFNLATLYYSDNIDECVACQKYIKSRLVRYLICITLSKTQVQLSEDRLRFVPLQDFTSNSDINWDKPVSEIDHQLYKKYNLSDDEIEYIEKTIKPMV